MGNRVARIDALRRYIALLQREEGRLYLVTRSLRANQQEREDAETGLQVAAQKIRDADMELRSLETGPKWRIL